VTRFLADTSCLVAAVCSWHEHHSATRGELEERARRGENLAVAAHTLLEAYAVLTRLPPPYRLRPADALALVEAVRERCGLVALTATETWSLVRSLPAGGIAGGSTYDALVAACARKAKAQVVLTWNVRDFARVAEGLEVVSPGTR